MTAAEERIYILDNFQRSMQKFQGKRIALYGLGVNTEYIVTHQVGNSIVALMDSTKEGEIYWELPVISKKQAAELTDVVVIVARKQSVPIIYERIAELEKKGITIVDVLGEKINQEQVKEEIDHNQYFERDYNCLLAEIERHEVITFDIFDTLIMRRTLTPENIFQ